MGNFTPSIGKYHVWWRGGSRACRATPEIPQLFQRLQSSDRKISLSSLARCFNGWRYYSIPGAIGIIVSHSSDHRLRECLLKMYYGHGKSDPCIMTAIVANPSRIISKPPCSQYFRGLYSQVHTVAVTPSSILYKADAIFRYHTPLRSPSPASKASEARTSLLPDHYWSFAGSKTCLD